MRCLALILVLAGCTSPYEVRVAGHVLTARPDAHAVPSPGIYPEGGKVKGGDLEPLPEAIVAISPRFTTERTNDLAYCGPVDEQGRFRYSSSGTSGNNLRGVHLRVTAPGFLPVETFVPIERAGSGSERSAAEEGRFDCQHIIIVLEEESRALSPGRAPP
jgi:hypothetical protein